MHRVTALFLGCFLLAGSNALTRAQGRIAGAASQGAVTSAELDARPLMRAGEVLETIPGLIVSQHSGEGKATSITCAASIWITAPISRPRSPACP
jgi:hypothetical protein